MTVTAEAGIVEMQVRTKDMHQRAQFGIASHMSYKSLAKSAGKGAFQGFSDLLGKTELSRLRQLLQD